MTEPRELVLVSDHEHVRVLTLNRPARRNALDLALARELRACLDEARDDAGVRVVVVTGAGGHYSAGADLEVFRAMAEGTLRDDPSVLGRLDQPLHTFTKPLIAAVDGVCVGMAVTTLPFFDMVYASERATFHTPFVRMGLVLEMGSSYTLPRLIGRQRASELSLRAEPVDAHTAAAWGLVTRVFASDQLMPEALRAAGQVALGSPDATAHVKRLLRVGEASDLDTALHLELDTLARSYASEAHRTAVQAFFARKRER
jgi:2-(1,2-epoxy-1,2-dihydrophenyl)acetyl-CoA isomerase